MRRVVRRPLVAGRGRHAGADPGQPAVSGGRRGADTGRALAARDAAQDAFVALDAAQQLTAARVLAFANLDGGRDGAAMQTAWAAVTGAADDCSSRFLATLDQYPVDDRRTPADLATAAGAFEAAHRAVSAVLARVETFTRSNEVLLTRVEQAYATLGPATAAAAAAAGRARDGAAAVRRDGTDSAELGRALAVLDERSTELARGASVHGVAATLRLAEQVRAAAGAVAAQTTAVARDRELATGALGSLPTRREVVDHKIAALAPVMSRLRQEYAERCFDDVARNPAQARAAADRAGEQAGLVERLLAGGHPAEAAAAASAARRLFGEAEAACAEVAERLELLDRAAADPHGTARQAWFVIRDAQRLVTARGPGAPPAWAARLDGAAHQLEGAERALVDGVHPDYLRFIIALDSARDTAAAVIADIRSHR